MANSPNPFMYRGTKVFHAVAAGAITVCRLVARDNAGKIVACPTAVRPQGVAPATYATGDDAAYHRSGICTVETDGSAAVGTDIKAAADGSGKGILDAAPGITTAGRVIKLDAVTNIAEVELFF